jgi:hypothetical protein
MLLGHAQLTWCCCSAADTVADTSSAVNQKLLKRRQQVEELNRVQNLLTRLQVRASSSTAPAASCIFKVG